MSAMSTNVIQCKQCKECKQPNYSSGRCRQLPVPPSAPPPLLSSNCVCQPSRKTWLEEAGCWAADAQNLAFEVRGELEVLVRCWWVALGLTEGGASIKPHTVLPDSAPDLLDLKVKPSAHPCPEVSSLKGEV